ncbi:LysR family transcriptional regulator [Vibrio astriarenae]|uniref:LysR family transcriptional regulator n=1 Tax=Vibrio astriarenae TaxID=1481923 RepID=A0A7Z2T7K1_9VIBR|nr:LysR family transcriptional regulator [Vibrio astriarenae]QIA65725.1 LysR family transcriptional regulator [Vibrio astriarenae]
MRFLDDFYIFCQVVEHGSMKKASEQLDVPLSTISRRVNSLEELVGTQLFIRSKTSLTPSNEGKRYYQRLSPHYQSLAEEIDNLRKDEQDVSGKVSIDCTPFVYDYFLKHKIVELVHQYPRLKLKFIPASDTSVIDPDADIAILTGDLPDSNLVAKKLYEFGVKVVVSKQYAQQHGVVTDINELKNHPFVGHLKNYQLAGYNQQRQQLETVHLFPKVVLTEAQAVLEMVSHGVGFCFTSEYFVERQLKDGSLVEWLPGYDFGKRAVSVAYRHRTLKSNAQQVVLDAISEAFQSHRV